METERAPADRRDVELALERRLAERDRISARLVECEARVAFATLRAEARAADGRCARALRDWESLWHRFNEVDAVLRAAAAQRGRKGRLGSREAAAVEALLAGPVVDDPDGTRSLAAEAPKLTLDAAVARMEGLYTAVTSLVDEIEAALDRAASEGAAGDGLPARVKALAARERALLERWRDADARISDPPVARPRTRAADLAGRARALPAFGEAGWIDALPARAALLAALDAADAAADASLIEVERPLRERNRMRSEAQALRARAERLGHVADPGFDAAWRRARAVLWTAPCSLPEARAALDALAPGERTE